LVEAKKMAEAANVAKTSFLYNMQHDLRTPFSGILGLAEFIERSEPDLRRKEQLHYISQSARTLLNHLNQIFEVVSLESGEMPLLEKSFHLPKLIEEIQKMMLPATKEKSLGFEVTVSPNTPEHVIGDQNRIERILINLLSNAIKFTEQGTIKLSVEWVSSHKKKAIIQFLVEDTGSGIPEEKQNLIFEQFKSTDLSSGNFPVKGLGLRLVKRSLDELGGEVHLTSHPGKGTTFKVLILFEETLVTLSEEEL